MSDSTIEIRIPPMTAMASGWSICDPAPMRERQRQHAGDRGERGHDDRPQTAASGVDDRLLGEHARGPEFLVRVEQQDAVLGDDADRP